MGAWVAIGFIVFMVVSSVIGIRLLLLWRRTRQLPEILIACGILLIGPVAFIFMLLASWCADKLPTLVPLCLAATLLSPSTGAFATAMFNWRVFRPEAPALRFLVVIIAALYVGSFLWEAHASGFADPNFRASGFRAYSFLNTAILLWGAAESLRYFTMMRRRAKLGLADPVVANRFLLWGLGIGAAGIGTAISVTAQLYTGQSMLEIPWVMVSNSLHGFTAAVLMWVAFIPPGFYRRFIESRSHQPAA